MNRAAAFYSGGGFYFHLFFAAVMIYWILDTPFSEPGPSAEEGPANILYATKSNHGIEGYYGLLSAYGSGGGAGL